MKILIAFDSFKDSLSSTELSTIISKEIGKKFPNIEIIAIPLADGGEGTLEALLCGNEQLAGINITAYDPLLREVTSNYLIDKKHHAIYLEMAQTCGLQLLKRDERNCFYTSSFGLGSQIKDSLHHKPEVIKIFIGGSATNDLGLGMAAALGAKFFTDRGLLEFPTGKDLIDIVDINLEGLDYLTSIRFEVVCDVRNLLLGEKGAATTYGPQKGASPKEIEVLEHGARNVANLLKEKYNVDFRNYSGAGAAGGMGFGAMTFLNAQIINGSEYLMDVLGVQEAIKKADIVITGEGKIDEQTFYGKLISEVVDGAEKNSKKVIVITALNTLNTNSMKSIAVDKFYTLYEVAPPTISKKDTIEKLIKVSQQICVDYL